jgi:hypothetical protein
MARRITMLFVTLGVCSTACPHNDSEGQLSAKKSAPVAFPVRAMLATRNSRAAPVAPPIPTEVDKNTWLAYLSFRAALTDDPEAMLSAAMVGYSEQPTDRDLEAARAIVTAYRGRTEGVAAKTLKDRVQIYLDVATNPSLPVQNRPSVDALRAVFDAAASLQPTVVYDSDRELDSLVARAKQWQPSAEVLSPISQVWQYSRKADARPDVVARLADVGLVPLDGGVHQLLERDPYLSKAPELLHKLRDGYDLLKQVSNGSLAQADWSDRAAKLFSDGDFTVPS